MQNQLVVFSIGNEFYGVDVDAVESIIKMQEITRLPHAPEFVEGITNLRGAVVPILDLRKRFGLEAVEATRDTRIMIVNMNNTNVGMVVDAVTQVVRISAESIDPPPQMAMTVNSAFIKGIAKLDEMLIILLDLKKVLTVDEYERLSAAL
ncbi:MAG: chemotaxis protein CheW [Anaerolineaceae bacterium]|jgi:purine-binding chemotaxis protein CheW